MHRHSSMLGKTSVHVRLANKYIFVNIFLYLIVAFYSCAHVCVEMRCKKDLGEQSWNETNWNMPHNKVLHKIVNIFYRNSTLRLNSHKLQPFHLTSNTIMNGSACFSLCSTHRTYCCCSNCNFYRVLLSLFCAVLSMPYMNEFS